MIIRIDEAFGFKKYIDAELKIESLLAENLIDPWQKPRVESYKTKNRKNRYRVTVLIEV